MLNEKEFLEIIGTSIRKKRTAKKLSCEKLAELSEVDYSSVNLIENQKQTPRSYTLYKILYALDSDIIEKLQNKSEQSQKIENDILSKVVLLDEDHKLSLLKFISNFEIKNK